MAEDKKAFGVGEKEDTGTPPGKMIGGLLKKAIGVGKKVIGGGMPLTNSAFKMRSGNTTPFKQMGSSPAKIVPSYINDVMVSDEDADIQDMLNQDLWEARKKGILKPGVFDENIKKVDREGLSQAIHIEKTEKDQEGKLGRLERDMIADAKKWAAEHPEEEAESYALNLANINKKKKEQRKLEEEKS